MVNILLNSLNRFRSFERVMSLQVPRIVESVRKFRSFGKQNNGIAIRGYRGDDCQA